MDGIVIDASVVGKWFLADEDDADRALGLRARLIDGDLEGFAPPHLPLEIAGALAPKSCEEAACRPMPVGPALAALDAFSLEVRRPSRPRPERRGRRSRHRRPSVRRRLPRRRPAARGAPLVTADEPLYQAGLRAGFDVVLLRDLPL